MTRAEDDHGVILAALAEHLIMQVGLRVNELLGVTAAELCVMDGRAGDRPDALISDWCGDLAA